MRKEELITELEKVIAFSHTYVPRNKQLSEDFIYPNPKIYATIQIIMRNWRIMP